MLMSARRAASAAAANADGEDAEGGGDGDTDVDDETKCESDGRLKSALAQSRLSIVSTAPSAIGSASQYCRYYNSSSASGGGGSGKKQRGNEAAAPQLCASRITQATMIGLVAIMSICLVTMCTLYVLDW